jgi:hypothetical protein
MCFKRCWRTGKISGELFITGDTSYVSWKTVVPPNTIICEKITYDIDEYKEKIKIWYPGEEMHELSREECLEIFNSYTKPWLWIGGDVSGNIVDVTDKIDKYVVSGNKITLDMLYKENKYITKWIYCDYKTLEITEFPSEGIIINDSVIKENTKKE